MGKCVCKICGNDVFITKKGIKKDFCKKHNNSNALNVLIIKYGKENGRRKFDENRKKYIVNEKMLIQKYGKEYGIIKWKEIQEKRKKSCTKKELIKKYGEKRFEKNSEKKKQTILEVNQMKRNNPKINITKIEYWLEKTNGNLEMAKQLLKERQTTFSKEKCIKKYGKEKGLKIWEERQKKWQKTLNDKSPEEIERINRAKMSTNGFSKISQELFWKIYNQIKNNYKEIYFAELNKEYFILTNNGNYFLDFYIKDNNKWIEFDGDYWDGSKGNIQRDKNRENNILNENNNFDLLRIGEMNFKKNTNKIIQKCIDFIKN